MKKIIFILTLFFYSFNSLHSQPTAKNSSQVNYAKIPQENIFVHYNASLLLSGEKLLFKIYCLNAKTKKLSDLSKVSYVELIGIDKKPIFKQKVLLKNGLGQGDFFIPTNIISGNYKLIAYTQWMRNGEFDVFFQGDINIINPFLDNQGTTKLDLNLDSISKEINIFNKDLYFDTDIKKTDTNTFIELTTNSQTYSNRDRITLNINSLLDENSFGNYSISVRKSDAIKTPNRLTSSHSVQKDESNLHEVNTLNYLPELRGELLSGRISSNGKELVANQKVALSILGKNSIFKIANTNKEGRFHFNLDNEYLNSEALVQVVGYKKEDFDINFDKKTPINYDNLVFNAFSITPEIKDLILERSIHNQLENAYNSIKSDSINDLKLVSPFYQKPDILEYVLDDYARFPTVKETFVEVIDKAWIIKENENYVFRLRSNDASNLSPILLVDGILIQNHTEFVDFNPKKIRKISILRDKYIYGSQKFGGIISVETMNNDFKNNISEDYITTHQLFRPEITKTYFTPNYTNKKKLDRIPDFRTQLFWLPNLILNKKETSISFYTSDGHGTYEISLEGFTNKGNPISIRKTITVTK